MANVQDTTDSDFASVLKESSVPVLVDFWAPWCGPCKAMGPAVEHLAGEMDGKLKVVKHNTQDHPGVATEFGVMAIPCFIVFKDGQEVARHSGMMNPDAFKAFVEPHV